MNETHDPSSLDRRANLSGIHNDVVGPRPQPRHRPSARPDACLAAGTDGAVLGQRELRAFCRRLLGWSEASAAVVDDAVDGLFTAVTRGMPIALRGASDLIPVAYALHRRILGAGRPFVVCDRRRREGDGSVRVPPSRPTAMLALEAAMNGSLCVRADRLPADFDVLCTSSRRDPSTATIFVCLRGDDRVRDLLCRPLEIPPLVARAAESDRLLREVLDDAAAALETAGLRVPRRLRHELLEHVSSFAGLEKTALRMVALASARNSSQAAQRLGMAPVSLSRWLRRRPWLTAILRNLAADREQVGG